MAFIQTKYCNKCEMITVHTNRVCNDCSERGRREKMGMWQALTVDEKLLNIHKRILVLERPAISF